MRTLRGFLGTLTAIAVLLAVGACRTAEPDVDRGMDPWVFRTVLDWKPRMIAMALKDDFWVAYDAERASLYKVWRDGVDLDGPVYTTAHGPQPTSIGNAYLVSPFAEPWSVLTDAGEIKPEIQYRGHRFEGDGVILRYDLLLPDGAMITIDEQPEYEGSREGRPGFERVFTTSNVPDGAQVALQTHLHSLRSTNSYQTDGRFEAGPVSEMAAAGGNVYTLDGRLLLKSNGATRMTAWFSPEPVVMVESGDVPDDEKEPGLVLIENSDCHACHNAEVKTVGPSYRAIAERYDSTAENVSMLAQKIIEGGGGDWTDEIGTAVMTPHPDLDPEDAAMMASYILGLAEHAAGGEEEGKPDPLADKGPSYTLTEDVRREGRGLVVNVYRYPGPLQEMPEPGPDDLPMYSGVVPGLHMPAESDFGELEEHFYVTARGQIGIPETTNYVFRLISDDGSILYIDDKKIVDHDGEHGATVMDGEVFLEAGTYPLRLEYFQGGGGKALSLQWIQHGEDDFSVIGPQALTYDEADLRETRIYEPAVAEDTLNAGDREPLADVHPAFRLETVRPPDFEPKVGGMDFLPDGRLVISTWDPAGTVYVLSNLDAGTPGGISVDPIATGLLEPLGIKVVDGEIYVMQKHELTHLIDHDGDGVTDEYRTVSDDWGATPNFHEFSFGLEYRDGYFYAALATAILPGGASAPDQNPDRGKVIKISMADGTAEHVASGLRTPNGLAFGVDGELFVADNQGDWLPSSKLLHIVEGRFYGNRSVEPEASNLEESPPVVWLPQNDIGNSPTQPALLNVGPYRNQMIHGDVTHGGLKRVFLEKVGGEYQGAVFRFTQGLEAGVNRIIWGPDGKLYVGGIGNPGNWSDYGKNWFGLQRLSYAGEPPFEMLAVRARADGLEIEFTEPVDTTTAATPESYEIRQWWYEPTPRYGGPKMDEEVLDVAEVRLSDGGRKAHLKIDGIEEGHVVYVRLLKPFNSANGADLWSTEAWYTMNRIPAEGVASADR